MDENEEKAKPETKGRTLTLDEIILQCVEEGDCLLWTGKTNRGQPVTDGTSRLCVRPMAYRLSKRREIPNGYRTYTSCGNKECMQGAHLLCGPPSAYMAAARKAGAFKGHKSQIARLRRAQVIAHPEKVREIRAALDTGASISRVARQTNVSRHYVSKIKRNKWRETLPGASVFNQ